MEFPALEFLLFELSCLKGNVASIVSSFMNFLCFNNSAHVHFKLYIWCMHFKPFHTERINAKTNRSFSFYGTIQQLGVGERKKENKVTK